VSFFGIWTLLLFAWENGKKMAILYENIRKEKHKHMHPIGGFGILIYSKLFGLDLDRSWFEPGTSFSSSP
jgi:hypothetical protein